MIAIAMLALGAAQAVVAPETQDFAGVPDVTVTYYDVSGDDATAIRLAMNAVRPVDPNDGKRVDSLTRTDFTWEWAGDGKGGCRLDEAVIRFRIGVTLPRLTNRDDLPAALQGRWDAYIAALEMHEGEHVTNAYRNRETVEAAIRSATCGTARAAGAAAIRRIVRADIAYDRRTRHGVKQGAVF